MKIFKNADEISEEAFEKAMNPNPKIGQTRMIALKDSFMKKMKEKTKEVIADVYGQDVLDLPRNIEAAIKHLSDVAYIDFSR